VIAAFNDDQKLVHNNLFLVSDAILSIGWSKLGQGKGIILEILGGPIPQSRPEAGSTDRSDIRPLREMRYFL